MHTILLTTDTADNAKMLADFLSTVRTVKSVSIDPKEKGKPAVSADRYNWTNPSRPATDKEFEQMIAECEAEQNLTIEEAGKLSEKKMALVTKYRFCIFAEKKP